ncbi:hypothetical protein [Nonomuraea sp. NPDC050786]|uniref:hypothetical protein n=1 Tax=Nonomuraea sp. NPDC050786 TaxID=3154840 RepID=UPI0033FEDE82
MRDGVDVVPAVLPIRISDDELKLTVADWLALKEINMSNPSPEAIPILDGQLPLPPYADAAVTVLDPDQEGLPQEPGSAIDDEYEEVGS